MNWILSGFLLFMSTFVTVFCILVMGEEGTYFTVAEAALLLSAAITFIIYWLKRSRRVKFVFVETKRIDKKTPERELDIKEAEYIRDRNSILMCLGIILAIYTILVIVGMIIGQY